MRQILKTCLELLAMVPAGVLACRFFLVKLFFRDPQIRRSSFENVLHTAASYPGVNGPRIRRRLLRIVGCNVAGDCFIAYSALFSSPDIEIASGAYIGAFTSIGSASIGSKTMIADGVRIPSGPRSHGTALGDMPMADQTGSPQHINIGKNCWIGANAVVMADVGDNAIVGAGAVVVKPVEPGCVVGGVPAKVIKNSEQRQAV